MTPLSVLVQKRDSKKIFFSARALGEKIASRESCPIRDKGKHKPNSVTHERVRGVTGGGSEEQKRKVEDDFINQSMITAELFPDRLTSGPRTGGVFKTHYYLY